MKKAFLIFCIFVLAVFLLKKFDSPKVSEKQTFSAKVEKVADEIIKQVSTSGPLRAKIQFEKAYLTSEGVLRETNWHRGQAGLTALKQNPRLDLAALRKAEDILARQYFEHIAPDGKGPAELAKAAGYKFIAIGENLALGNYQDDKVLVQAWMDSPGHRANILGVNFEEIGIATIKGEFEGKITWVSVQEFGRPESSCPSIDIGLKNLISEQKAELEDIESWLSSEKAALLLEPKPQTQEEAEKYNLRVGDYNNSIKVYNNLVDTIRVNVARYNRQVREFNECGKQ